MNENEKAIENFDKATRIALRRFGRDLTRMPIDYRKRITERVPKKRKEIRQDDMFGLLDKATPVSNTGVKNSLGGSND